MPTFITFNGAQTNRPVSINPDSVSAVEDRGYTGSMIYVGTTGFLVSEQYEIVMRRIFERWE